MHFWSSRAWSADRDDSSCTYQLGFFRASADNYGHFCLFISGSACRETFFRGYSSSFVFLSSSDAIRYCFQQSQRKLIAHSSKHPRVWFLTFYHGSQLATERGSLDVYCRTLRCPEDHPRMPSDRQRSLLSTFRTIAFARSGHAARHHEVDKCSFSKCSERGSVVIDEIARYRLTH